MDLKNGIPISESEVLKWNISKEELFQIGTPTISESGTFARWEKIRLFNDDLVNITVSFDSENPNNKLEYVRVECQEIEDSENANAPQVIYDRYSDILNNTYGAPTEEETFHSLPIRKWVFENHEIILGIAERFMDYSIFVIKLNAT
jgi:hypothetical protein